ncbi:MAG: aldo/keto reductase, partial [Flavobacteriia bacterium]
TTIWSPLASGILSGKYNDQFPDGTRLGMEGLEWLKEKNLTAARIQSVLSLTDLAKELGLSLPVMSLAWCLKNPNVSTVILGASKLVQLEENMKALSAQSLLTPDVMQRIEEILQNKPQFPPY